MLLTLHELKDSDKRKLMDIYAEGNLENVDYFYPDCKNKSKGLEMIENEFCDYIRRDFFKNKENTYFVLEKEGIWISALRLYKLKDFYYLEALETHPKYRRRGYGTELLLGMLSLLREEGRLIVRDNVRKSNIPSLACHRKCGFEIEHENAINYLTGHINENCYGMVYRG